MGRAYPGSLRTASATWFTADSYAVISARNERVGQVLGVVLLDGSVSHDSCIVLDSSGAWLHPNREEARQ